MSFSIQTAFDFSGQVVLVTGGAAGIGRAISQMFAECGARVALVDRDQQVIEVAAALPGHAVPIIADVADERQVVRAVADCIEACGRIDVLVNNAGIGPLAPSEDTPCELWDLTMAVNLRGPFLFAREVGRHMLLNGRGRIINLASQAALVSLEGHLAYCASKAGVLGMTRVLAAEWGPRGITTNAVSPTVVNTDLGARGSWAGEKGDAFRRKIPVGRFAEPDEIAAAVLYLASAAAGMVNGENLVVDGGYTAT